MSETVFVDVVVTRDDEEGLPVAWTGDASWAVIRYEIVARQAERLLS